MSNKNLEWIFKYGKNPVHRLDETGDLAKLGAEGSAMANLQKSSKFTTQEERKESIRNAYDACMSDPPVTVAALADYLGKTERCIRDRLGEMKDEFWRNGGMVGRVEQN